MEQQQPRERGFVEYRCAVCGERTTSSTITSEYAETYDPGAHCGIPFRMVRWVPNIVHPDDDPIG